MTTFFPMQMAMITVGYKI